MTTEERIEALERKVTDLEARLAKTELLALQAHTIAMFGAAGITIPEDKKAAALKMLGPLEKYAELFKEPI